MAKEEKKLQSFNSFNAGEYSPELAGRVDLESFGSSTRYMSNMMSQVSGGVKKFYGTKHIVEKPESFDGQKVKLIPFVNRNEPMAFVLWEPLNYKGIIFDTSKIEIGLVTENEYYDLGLFLPGNVLLDDIRWQQVNDKVFLVSPSMQPMSINFLGIGEGNKYLFDLSGIEFSEIPYFPVGAADNYVGPIKATGVSGTVNLTIVPSAVYVMFPTFISDSSSYTRTYSDSGSNRVPYRDYYISKSTVTVYRVRGEETTEILSNVNCNRPSVWKHHSDSKIEMTDVISQESVLQAIRTKFPDSYIRKYGIALVGVEDALDGDYYYMKINVGEGYYSEVDKSIIWPSEIRTSEMEKFDSAELQKFDLTNIVGRKIKFYFNDDIEVSPWWQGKSVKKDDYAFSNGHWYKALEGGTCGNIQPSHTTGYASDGSIVWKYVHSGSASASVIDAVSQTELVVQVPEGSELPVNIGNEYNNYAWSIWGVNGKHPSDIYMAGNRLCFICNTDGYGAWNTMSVVDDYFNMSTEEYGQQLDTSAIVHVIANNDSGSINWVLARNTIYMGSYSGEYSVRGGNSGVFTPLQTVVENISNIGGVPVVPLKYKELNVFVGSTSKELYSIGYDYTIDDYIPKELGIVAEHILEKGVKRIVPLNNRDRNIYILSNSNTLSMFNYVKEQKVLGFSELDFCSNVIDFVATSSNDKQAGFVVTKRNEGHLTFECFSIGEPTYMLDTIEHKQSKTKNNVSVVSTDVDGTYFDPIQSLSNGLYKKDILVEGNEYQSELYELKDGSISKCERFNGAYSGVGNYKVPVYMDGDIILTYAKDPSNSAGIFNKLYVSLDGGSTWNDNKTPSISYGVFSFAAVKNNIFVVAYDESTPGSGGVYVSFDYGVTWKRKQELITAKWVGFAGGLFFCLLYDGTLKYSADAETWNDCCKVKDLSEGNQSRDPYIIKEVAGLYYLYSNSDTTVQFLHIIKIGFGVINSVVKEGYIYPLAGNKFLLISRTDASAFLCEYDDKTNSIIRKEATDGFGDIINKENNGIVKQKTDNVGNLFYWGVYSDVEQDKYMSVLSISEQAATTVFCPTKHHANKEVWVKFGEDLSQFKKVTLDAEGNTTEIPDSPRYQVGLPMVCELHTQPAFGNKVEGMQQQSIAVYLRLHKSGAFYYGSSVDFDKYFEYSDWPDRQGFGEGRALYTGDCALNIPLGYAEAANQGDARYPNSSAVGINIKCDTPEPFNLLAIQEIYK